MIANSAGALLVLLASAPAFAQAQDAAEAPSPPPLETPAPPRFQFERPAGFDDLLAEREESLTIYWDGAPLGEVQVWLSPGSLRFADVPAVLRLLPPLRQSEGLLAALSKPLATNAGLSCSPRPTAGCGRLEPDVAGVILTRDGGRLDLFVSSQFRGPPRRFLAEPLPGPVGINGALGFNYALSQRGIDLTMRPRVMLGLGRSHFAAEASFSERQSSLDRAFYRRHWNRATLSAGLVQASNFNFVYFDRLVGLSLASSDDLEIVRGNAADSPLILDAPLQGRVEILRDGVLLDTQRITPGRATLSTAQLPGGAYPLTLRITDASGERVETRFFTRAEGLPRFGETEYFVEGGWNTRFRTASDGFVPRLLSPTLRAGLRHRLGPQIGLFARSEATEVRQMVEGGLIWVGDGLRFNATGAATAQGDWATALNASGRLVGLNWSIDGRRLRSQPQGPGSFDNERGLSRSSDQLSGSLSYSGTGFSLGSSVLWRREPGRSASFTVLPNARATLLQQQGRRLELDMSGSYSTSSWTARAGLRLYFSRRRASMSLGGGAETRHRNGQTRIHPLANADWSQSSDTELGPLQMRAGISQQFDRLSARAGANLTTQFVVLAADAQIEEQLSASSLYGRVETSFGLADGKLAFGSGGFTGSGLVVQAPDADADARYAVRALGAGSRQIRGSAPVFVPTSPFSQGEVGLNAGAGATSFDTRSEAAVFYPGTVRSLVRGSTRVTVVLAQLLRADGAPLAQAAVESGRAIGDTDDQGRLQIEVPSAARLLAETADGARCVVNLPAFATDVPFVSLGRLTCLALEGEE